MNRSYLRKIHAPYQDKNFLSIQALEIQIIDLEILHIWLY